MSGEAQQEVLDFAKGGGILPAVIQDAESGEVLIVQEVRELLVDCDGDAVVAKVHQVGGAACHTGYNSCFYRRLEDDGATTTIKTEKVFDPDQVYGT